MRDQTLSEASPEKYRRCPQLWFDPMLAACVARTGMAEMHYGWRLAGFLQSDAAVLAEVVDEASGEAIEVEAQYLVGCDGPGSTVRKILGIGMEGESALSYSNGIYLTAPGLLDRHDKAKAERYVMIGPEGNWGSLTVVDGESRWRLTVNGNRQKAEEFDAVAWVRRAFGDDSIPFTIESVLPGVAASWSRSATAKGAFSLWATPATSWRLMADTA
jgi:2-polyprenyl-6-methoxyphenol hydroxylase-like FAD-dependent oxidoreductase